MLIHSPNTFLIDFFAFPTAIKTIRVFFISIEDKREHLSILCGNKHKRSCFFKLIMNYHLHLPWTLESLLYHISSCIIYFIWFVSFSLNEQWEFWFFCIQHLMLIEYYHHYLFIIIFLLARTFCS